MYSLKITMAEFADINDRIEISDRQVVGPVVVTTGDCPGLGRVVAIQTDQGVTLLSELQFFPRGYRRSIIYRRPGSPLADIYAWN